MLLFHGTTLENALKIQQEGFSYDKKVWDCSLNETYFFKEDFFWKEYCDEDSSFEEMLEYAVRHALDQARIVLAVENPEKYIPAVLIFDSNLMKNKEELKIDESCPNMDGMALALENPDMNGLVAIVYTNVDEKITRWHQIKSLQGNEYFNMPELSSLEEAVLNAFSLDSFCEIIDELSNVNFEIKWFKQLDYSSKDRLEKGEETLLFFCHNCLILFVLIKKVILSHSH